MRSIRLLAAVSGTLVLGSACGGGGTGPNQPPVANFTAPTCTTNQVCNFTDASTDDHGVSTWLWTFGDGETSDVQNPAHTFKAAQTYSVVLKVTDGSGETATKTNSVVVSDPAPTGPTANFTTSCNGPVCTFTSTSTDADGTIASYLWDFGEPSSGNNNTANQAVVSHTYTVTAPNTAFTVSLTVTDNDGAPATKTQAITLSPPAGLQCNGVDCTLDLTSKSTVTLTVTSADCQFTGNAFTITSPIQETVFTDGCSVAPGTVFNINGGAAFNAGTQLAAQFTQGSGTPSAPPKGPPATRVTGSFPDWTIELDDGGNPTGPGEPDFNDIVLAVHATVVP